MANAIKAAEEAILRGDEERLYEALKAMGVQNLQAHNKGWYLKQLQADRESKEQVGADDATTLYKELLLIFQFNPIDDFLSLGVSGWGAD